jgi:serine/threonine-protein kinase
VTDPLLGEELGDYRIESQIGRGGMGVVYRATELSLRRSVALKVLLPEYAQDTAARQRFQREIDLAVGTEHPHIVPVYSAGFEPPHFYIAMRFVPGQDLNQVCRTDGALDQDRALRLLGQIASALFAVHGRSLVHRDVKPHNVLLWGSGEDEHAMLTDFGIAKALDDSLGLTGMGAVGTPAYMAPELFQGRSASPASDQYSLACLAFELLAGRPPFQGGAAELQEAHVTAEPPLLLDVSASVSPALSDAIARALLKDPASRFPDVREFVRAAATGAGNAFDRSEHMSRSLAEATAPEAAAEALLSQDVSDAVISHLTDLDRTDVVRLRRKLVRRNLTGHDRG